MGAMAQSTSTSKHKESKTLKLMLKHAFCFLSVSQTCKKMLLNEARKNAKCY